MGEPYRLRDTSWTKKDENEFSAFVAAMGESNCLTVNQCFKSAANTLRSADENTYSFKADCSDFPYMLRAYFAAKKGLPFSYASRVEQILENGERPATYPQYSPHGNRVVERITFRNGEGVFSLFDQMNSLVDSRMMRTPVNYDDRENPADFYSAALNRESIRPGTIFYDFNGHVAIIYRVEDNGRIRYFDSHPDQSISRGTFRSKFPRSAPWHGGGFKNFKSERMDGNEALPPPLGRITSFSDEQYFGTPGARSGNRDWTKARFVNNGLELPFHEYVREKLAVPGSKRKAEDELADFLHDMCADAKDRVESVLKALQRGLDSKPHPRALPESIFGTDAPEWKDWEDFASPSRDARLRADFAEVRRLVEDAVMHPQKYVYTSLPGRKLDSRNPEDRRAMKAALLQVYKKTASCRIYKYSDSGNRNVYKSDGSIMTLHDLAKRASKLSFDPYHCEARRWGETDPAALRSMGCIEDSSKRRWYDAEQRLRNSIERNSPYSMAGTLEDYENGRMKAGASIAPDTDTYGFLTSD